MSTLHELRRAPATGAATPASSPAAASTTAKPKAARRARLRSPEEGRAKVKEHAAGTVGHAGRRDDARRARPLPQTSPATSRPKAQPPSLPQAVADAKLATKYFFSFDHIGPFTTEEIVRFARFNLEALIRRAPGLHPDRVVGNLAFATHVLEERRRAWPGPLEELTQALQQLSYRRYPAAECAPRARALLAALDAFAKKHGLISLDGVSDRDSAEARQILRFWTPLSEFYWHLGRLPTGGFDRPDFKQRMVDLVAQAIPLFESSEFHATGSGRELVQRAADEMRGLLERIDRQAMDVDRPDIAASARRFSAQIGARVQAPTAGS